MQRVHKRLLWCIDDTLRVPHMIHTNSTAQYTFVNRTVFLCKAYQHNFNFRPHIDSFRHSDRIRCTKLLFVHVLEATESPLRKRNKKPSIARITFCIAKQSASITSIGFFHFTPHYIYPPRHLFLIFVHFQQYTWNLYTILAYLCTTKCTKNIHTNT